MQFMKPLRIALVMIEPPLPFGNAAARWFYVLLRGLVERGHRVTAFAACSHDNEMHEAQRLFPSPDFDLRCFPLPPGSLQGKFRSLVQPYSNFFSGELRANLREVMASGI